MAHGMQLLITAAYVTHRGQWDWAMAKHSNQSFLVLLVSSDVVQVVMIL